MKSGFNRIVASGEDRRTRVWKHGCGAANPQSITRKRLDHCCCAQFERHFCVSALGSERRSAWDHVRKSLMSLLPALPGGNNFRIRFTADRH